ncbi:MAG: alpha/beta hydrolase [Deltaproteobacteria bacterium]|nr:alpha/beta hydrolase [Deltaproteobacteria bacterium]
MQVTSKKNATSKKYVWSQKNFLSHDGTPIGYQVIGDEGNPPFLLANGLGGTHQAYRLLTDAFGDRFCFYCWDYRGMYTSGRPVSGYSGLSIDHHAKDALALMEHVAKERTRNDDEKVQKAAQQEPFFAFGWSMGVQVILEMHRYAPEKLKGIVLHNGVAGRPYQTLAGTHRLEKWTPFALKKLQGVDGKVTKTVQWAVERTFLIPLMVRLGLVNHNLDRALFTRMAKNFKELDWHLYLETLRQLGEHDATDCLPKVKAPLLMIASSHDAMTPINAAEKIVDNVKNARLEVVDGGTHYAAVEFPEVVHGFLETFLKKHWPKEAFSQTSKSSKPRRERAS